MKIINQGTISNNKSFSKFIMFIFINKRFTENNCIIIVRTVAFIINKKALAN